MKAPVGSVVSITYDGFIVEGDVLRTTTGRMYWVIECRVQMRGKHRGRHHLKCLVVDEVPEDVKEVRPLYWYPRGKR